MIETKKDLKSYVLADDERFDSTPTLFNVVAGNLHKYRIRKFIHILRYLEYWSNNRDSYWGKLMYVYYNNIYNRLQWKYGMYIEPNVFGKGLYIVHPGYIWIDQSA